MAAKVNIKFVIVLSIVLVAVFGGVATMAYYTLTKSGADYEAAGDAAFDAGEFEKARELYGRAVGHDKTNVVWLEKWLKTSTKLTKQTQAEYVKLYQNGYYNVLRQIAQVSRTDVDAHHRYLGELYERVQMSSFERDSIDMLLNETDLALRNFMGQPEEGREWPTLHRYKGIAVSLLIGGGADVSEEDLEAGKESLVKAIAADPADSLSATTLARMYAMLAQRERMAQREDLAEGLEQNAERTIDSFLSDNPDDISARVTKLQLEMDRATREATDGVFGRDLIDAVAAAAVPFQDRALALGQRLNDAPAGEVSLIDLQNYYSVLARISAGETGAAEREFLGLLEARTEKEPDNADLLLRLGTALGASEERRGEAADVLQRVVDLPLKPTSLEGLRLFSLKTAAVYQQATYALQGWVEAREGEPGTDMPEVDAYRAELDRLIAADDPRLVLLDAKIAFAKSEFRQAQRLGKQYNDMTQNQSAEGLWFESQAALRANQLGIAELQLNRLVNLQSNNFSARVARAQVLAQLSRTDDALRALEDVLKLDPEHEPALALRERIQRLEGTIDIEDPEEAAILEAQRLALGDALEPGDPREAVRVLERAVGEVGMTERLAFYLVRYQSTSGDEDGARATLEQAKQEFPDSAEIDRLYRFVNSEDKVAVLIDSVDAGSSGELTKALTRYRIYMDNGMVDEARVSLDQAAAIEPENAAVIEYQFLTALATSDRDAMDEAVAKATRLDLDGVQGLTYRGRAALGSRELEDAANIFAQATEQDPSNAVVWRLLAGTQMDLGRGAESLESFQRALEIRPNDVITINQYMRALVRLNRVEEALDVARESQRYGSANQQFMERWLSLEGQVGDKSFARTRRERIRELEPDNRSNTAALAGIYIDLAMWDDARVLIDDIREDSTGGIQDVVLDARWHVRQGNVEGAQAVFQDFIIDQEAAGEVDVQTYVVFGQFMIENGRSGVGITALEQAREHQTPGVLEADKALASVLSGLGQRERAIELLQEIVNADADNSSNSFRLRLIELLALAERYDDADAQLAALGDEGGVTAQLLVADVARRRGNDAQALSQLDDTVQAYPDQPMVFVARARLRATSESGFQDALTDLDNALQLQPGLASALRLRADIKARRGDIDGALADLREAVVANPGMDELRVGLMGELIAKDRPGEAFEIAQQAVEVRPNDLTLVAELATVFAARSMWERAARLYEAGWESSKQQVMAQLFLDATLNADNPDLRGAEAVLLEVGNDAISSDPGLLLARATVSAQRRRYQDATRDSSAALELVSDTPSQVLSWFTAVRRVFDDDDARILDYLAQVKRGTNHGDWADLFAAQTNIRGDQQRAGLSLLERLAQGAEVEEVRILAYRAAGSALYSQERFSEAAAAWNQGIETFPRDWEMRNNLAFVLAKHLGQPEAGIEHAQAAVEAAPNSVDALDTLGVCQHLAGQLESAEATLKQALDRSQFDQTGAMVAIHLGRVKVSMGKLEDAELLYAQANNVITELASTSESHKQALAELREQIDSAG